MKNGIYKIFVINPGSTSTKLSLFHNEEHILTTDVFHDSSVLKTFPTINDQLDYRMEVIRNFIKENELDLSDLDAIVGRGGPCYAVESGTFEVDDLLIADTKAGKGGLYHASMLGVQMAREMQKEYGGRIFMLDPTVVDEYWDLSRISGIDGIYRHSICHALNLKATARKHAASLGKRYEDCRFIGQGPFTPTRMGSMAVTDVVDYLWDKTPQEMKNLTSVVGGLSSYFGTSNTDKIHELIDAGDKRANRVWDAMIYQIAKYIGAMASAMSGKVDAIVLTGGLLRFPEIEEKIRGYCGYIAPVSSYPGECEQEAMCLGALRVLRGEEEPKHYTGHPVWQGFND